MGTLSLSAEAGLLINEFSATHSDRLLVREVGEFPRVGNTVPWRSADFDDSGWMSGNGPFGSGVSGVSLGTNVANFVQNQTPTLYLRKSFSVSAGNAASSSELELDIRYDDGFIAFINGVEVARRNMGFAGMFAYHDQPAYNTHTSTAVTTIDLGQASSLLQSGDNLLTIQVHNQSSSGAGGLLLGADLNLASGASILDGDGSWKFFAGLAAPSGGLVDHGLLTLEAAEAPDVLWATTSFDDSTWPVGVGPVGYDISSPPDYVTGVNLITEMRGVTPSVYTRSNFTVTQAEADSAFPLSLVVDFDDGMIVYVNGFEVFRDNVGTAGAVTPHDVPADGNHAATEDVANATDHSLTIALDAARDLLVPGNNVIGVQLHNASAFSSDLIGRVTLRTTGASPRDLVVPSSSLRYFVGTEEPVLQGEEDDIEVIADPFDSENDWIEIRNTDSAEVSLDGWSLSDDPTDPRKWSFPTGVVVPADGYLVVVASGLGLTQRGDGMTFDHTNFKLSAAGDRLVLTRPDDQVEDQLLVNYPAQSWRYSYGRQADGAFGYLSLGTPGAANVGSVLGVAAALPSFSVEGGFHPSSVSLVLSSSTPGATVRYSTDGTDPIDGTDYAGPISISDNEVIRARSILAGSIPSEVATHTYLINQGAAYQSLPAMILSGDPAKTFYGPNASGGPADGEGIFAINGGNYNSGSWSANGEEDAFNHPKGSGRAAEKYGAIEYLPLSGAPLRTELGMRVAGSNHTRQRLKITDPMDQPFTSTSTSTTKFEKPSMNIFFRPEFGDRPIDYPFFNGISVTEFDSLRVRAGKNDWYNPFIKDELMRRLYINTGQVGSYGTMHTLWINGVYKGYYNTAERVREGFMQAHYNSKASWDVQQVNSFSSGDPTHWNQMISYLRTTDLTTTGGYAGVHDFLDVDNYIDYILVNAYAAMGDWPHNNWIAARERSSLGRWRFYVWDAEGAFGFAGRSTSTNSFTEQLTLPSTRYPTASAQTTTSQYIQAIYTLLKASPEFRLRMADRAQKQLFNGGPLTTAEVAKVYNELRTEVSPIIQETGGGSFRSSFYTGWISNGTRYNALLSQLGGENAWPSTDAPTINQFGGEIAAGFQATLGNPNGSGTVYYTTDGSDPRTLGGAVSGLAYSGAIPISDDTRVRARVLQGGTWSPEIDAEFTLPFANPTFLPLASADWSQDINWSSNPSSYPDGADVTAVVPGAAGADRNVNLRAPVTIGNITFDLENTENRSRVRDRDFGNTLTFSNSVGPAEILVTGDGSGFAELEVEAGTILSTDLRLDVQHQDGDSEYGALRVRSEFSGLGGLIKTGPGIASLTGSEKNYSGATVIEQGVLQLTEPAAPSLSSSIDVLSGGQLRLTSGTGAGDPDRNYVFGGTLSLTGSGRGNEIADGAGNGKLGALRYDPGSLNDRAVISSTVVLMSAAEIHVEGSSNRLEISTPLIGPGSLSKSGGGTLLLSGDQSGQSFQVAVASGTLEIQSELGSTVDLAPTATLRGHGGTNGITGEGSVVLAQTLLESPTSNASRYSFVFGSNGVPALSSAAAALNGTAILENAPTGVLAVDFYLTGSAQGLGALSQGGLIVPSSVDLSGALSMASIRVFSADPTGNHDFEGQSWRPVQGFDLSIATMDLGLSSPFNEVKILGVTNEENTPASFEAWRQSVFTAGELADSAISGPLAAPFGDGVSNLLRYAFGVPNGANAEGYQARIESGASGIEMVFPFDLRRDDIVVTVESSESLKDWSGAVTLFDSEIDSVPLTLGSGWVRVSDERATVNQRFFRIRVVEK